MLLLFSYNNHNINKRTAVGGIPDKTRNNRKTLRKRNTITRKPRMYAFCIRSGLRLQRRIAQQSVDILLYYDVGIIFIKGFTRVKREYRPRGGCSANANTSIRSHRSPPRTGGSAIVKNRVRPRSVVGKIVRGAHPARRLHDRNKQPARRQVVVVGGRAAARWNFSPECEWTAPTSAEGGGARTHTRYFGHGVWIHLLYGRTPSCRFVVHGCRRRSRRSRSGSGPEHDDGRRGGLRR